MNQHIGKPASAVVKTGETVKTGQLIASVGTEDMGGANVHASIDGIVSVNDKFIIIEQK